MKKLFTLLAAALAAATVSAQDVQTVFSAVATSAWSVPASTTEAEITSSYATISGGKMYVTNKQTAAKDLIKKQSNVMAFSHTNNDTFFKVELDEPLQAGDVVTTDLCRHKENEIGIWMSAASARPSDCTAAITVESTGTQEWVAAQTYTVAEGDGICGESTFYIYRSAGKTNYFTNFTITREVQPTGPFYAVVGSAALFGQDNEWNQATTTDYMTAGADGIYTWTKENVTLSENAELKVIKKENKEDAEAAAWYPDGNNVTLDGWTKAASYNVTVTFDPANETVTAKAERIITIGSMAIVGDFSPNGWEPAQGLAMTQDETKPNIWTLTIADFEAEVKTYQYKATANGTWDDYVLPEGDNAKWTPTAAAKYDLVFTVDTEKHELTLAAQKQSSVEIGKLYIVGEITGGWPTEATDGDDGWSMAKEMKQSSEDANVWTLEYNTYITVEDPIEGLKLEYKAAADKAWTFAIPQTGNNDYIFYQSGQYNMKFIANVADETLSLIADLEQAPEFAKNAIYGWQSPTGYAYEQGGVAEGKGGAENRVNYLNSGYYTLSINGKKADVEDETKPYIEITLDEEVSLNDTIIVTGYYTNKDEKKTAPYFLFSNGKAVYDDALTYNNIYSGELQPNTNKYIISEDAAGCKSFKIVRSQTGTNLFITRLEIVKYIEQIETMYIVGDFTGGWPTEAAEGTPADWSMAQAMTQDAENPNLWTLTVENFEVKFAEGETSKTYYYKATANQKWGLYELPAAGANNNWVFADGSDYPAGVYDLVFTADTEANTLTVVPTYDEVATGIASVQSVKPAQAIFNLAGQRVSGTQKGLYIVGGKKVVR